MTTLKNQAFIDSVLLAPSVSASMIQHYENVTGDAVRKAVQNDLDRVQEFFRLDNDSLENMRINYPGKRNRQFLLCMVADAHDRLTETENNLYGIKAISIEKPTGSGGGYGNHDRAIMKRIEQRDRAQADLDRLLLCLDNIYGSETLFGMAVPNLQPNF